MKKPFNDYSKYYDLLYGDKDYSKEVDYIHSIIQKRNPLAKSILDLGCGTGIHANMLASLGYSVTGVDFSEQMIDLANIKKDNEYKLNENNLTFKKGDIRELENIIDSQFDVVISLFHVFSYLSENHDVICGLQNIIKTTKTNGGIAIFDFWYGPGVLTDLPKSRTKTFENEFLKVNRFTYPELLHLKNTVNVNFRLEISDKENEREFTMEETHRMRYYFFSEIKYFLNDLGIKDFSFNNWLSMEPPDISSFSACVILEK